MQQGRDKDGRWWSELDRIQDPETGLALLAKYSGAGEETPEQLLNRFFWQEQFRHWQGWRDGDVTAVMAALRLCSLHKWPAPTWLEHALSELCMRCISEADKRAHTEMNTHYRRWKAVKLVRGQHANDPGNFSRKVHGDAVWEEAAKLVAGTHAEAKADTVRKSYALIRRAGGAGTTLPSYRRAVEERDRRRKKK
jgi:hypothetical protein